VNVWCAKRGIRTEDAPDFQGHVRADIPGTHIKKIVTVDDAEFLTLTAHNTWRTPLK